MTDTSTGPAATLSELYPAVDAQIDSALDDVGDGFEVTKQVLESFLRAYPRKEAILSYPLLVHGAQVGDPRPAVPVSAIHVIWLTSARFLDDVADGAASPVELRPDEALLAAIVCSHSLPTAVIAGQELPDRLRHLLMTDLAKGSLIGVEGQLREFRAVPAAANRESVLRCYRGKNGVGFAMSGVMAARLAGADPAEVDLWREFGLTLGALRQLRSDQEDLVSGRDEDLKNRVVTYLFSCVVSTASERDRQRAVSLHLAAQASPDARRELRTLLLAPEYVGGYLADVEAMRDKLQGLLDKLDCHPQWAAVLRSLVDSSARPHPLFAQLAR